LTTRALRPRTRRSVARVRDDRLGDRARVRSRAEPPSRSRSFGAPRARPVEPIGRLSAGFEGEGA
jgi:hypothetical protein